jgi:prepilin-type processing-associated H-X9-DG protein
MQMPVTTDPNLRYAKYRETQLFLCPANFGVMTTPFGAATIGAGQMLGYATNGNIMMTPASPAPGVTDQTRISGGATWWALPDGHGPRLPKIKLATNKILVADAGKFVNSTTGGTFTLHPYPTPNGSAISSQYSDWGAFTTATRAYDRTVANGGTGFDGRLFSFRHGQRRGGLPFGSYRMNAVFVDGHAETLDEARATNPALWLPTGSTIRLDKIPADVRTRHRLTEGMIIGN